MDTKQILTILKQTINGGCLGVFPSDLLPEKFQKPSALVVNTDSSNQPGKHWVAIFINSDCSVEYFDSYGLKPQVSAISKFLLKFKNCRYNKKPIQGLFSSVCGHYCIFFLIQRWNKVPMEDILNSFSSGNREENDEYITDWVNENFQMNTETFNIEFLVNQICLALK
jgi:hypothetical protein